MKQFTALFGLLSIKAADDSENGRVTQGIRIVPLALNGGKAPVIITEASNLLCITLTAFYPLERAVYLAALSKQGVARIELCGIGRKRGMALTGGVDEREGCHYLYATLDMPLKQDNSEAACGELYRLMDTLAVRMGVRFKEQE